MHGYSFELICSKFGAWHRYNLGMVMGGYSEHRSRYWARTSGLALCALSIYKAIAIYTTLSGCVAISVGKSIGSSELTGGRRKGPSTAGARIERCRCEE